MSPTHTQLLLSTMEVCSIPVGFDRSVIISHAEMLLSWSEHWDGLSGPGRPHTTGPTPVTLSGFRQTSFQVSFKHITNSFLFVPSWECHSPVVQNLLPVLRSPSVKQVPSLPFHWLRSHRRRGQKDGWTAGFRSPEVPQEIISCNKIVS